MILFKVNRLNKVSTLLPTPAEILKLYNKYRKGYDYTKEAWEMKDKVLYSSKLLLKRSMEVGKKLDEFLEENPLADVNDFFDKYTTRFLIGNREWNQEVWKLLQDAISTLQRAKDPFDILVAVDHIFNIYHDSGPILQGLLNGYGQYRSYGPPEEIKNFDKEQQEVENFIATLNQIRDW